MSGRGAVAEGAGFNTGVTWDTAIVLGADDGLKILGEELAGGAEALAVEEIGDPEGGFPERGNEAWAGPIRMNARYGGNVARFIAHVIGGEALTDNTGTATHLCAWTDELARFMTFCRGRDATNKWREFRSLKLEEVILSWQNGGRVLVEARALASSMNRDSATNTRTVTSACLVPAGRRQVMGAQAVVRMNAQAGGALAGGDVVRVQSGRLIFRRPLSRPFETSGGGRLSEPQPTDAAEVLVELDLERKGNDDFIDQWESTTPPAPKKLDLTFSSGVIPAGGNEMKWIFQYPNVQIAMRPQDPVAGPGLIPHKLVYKATGAAAAPTGMTAVTAPVVATFEDERITSYFT